MKYAYDYEALDLEGYPYIRKALTIGEMPLSVIPLLLKGATIHYSNKLCIETDRTIPFGAPVYTIFMSCPEAKKHEYAVELLKHGADIEISILEE